MKTLSYPNFRNKLRTPSLTSTILETYKPGIRIKLN